jgi:type II secretory pathway pseudopilin PulG
VKITLNKNANCRFGPSQVFNIFTSYNAGDVLDVDGYNDDLGALWYYVKIPNQQTGHCWISASSADASSDTSCLGEILSPPTPTPTPDDTTPPSAPIIRFPVDENYFNCGESVILTWEAVQDPSGISYYEWIVEMYDNSSYNFSFFSSGQTDDTKVGVDLKCYLNFLWYVRAVDGRGNIGPYSELGYFTVGE